MITLRFGPAALAHVRFAISPLVEVRRSRRLLDDPAAGALHLPWLVEALERTADLDLSLLRALDPTGVYTPDFVSPPPDTPLAELEDELAVVAATPPEQARAEVQRSYRRKPPLPAVLEPFVEDPARGLAEVVALLRLYWERALAPHWRRVRVARRRARDRPAVAAHARLSRARRGDPVGGRAPGRARRARRAPRQGP